MLDFFKYSINLTFEYAICQSISYLYTVYTIVS